MIAELDWLQLPVLKERKKKKNSRRPGSGEVKKNKKIKGQKTVLLFFLFFFLALKILSFRILLLIEKTCLCVDKLVLLFIIVNNDCFIVFCV